MNILIVGCSMSASSGFNNPSDKIWHSLITNANITNLSIDGQSNYKIFIKTISEIIKNPTYYDLVIVQWTSLFRLSLNDGHTIHDNQTNFTLFKSDKKFKKFHSVWINNFCNLRVDLLEWLSYITVLTTFLKSYKQKFIFVKALDNFLPNLAHVDWHNCSPIFLERVLHLSVLPDEEITEYYNEVHTSYLAMVETSESYWLNLHTQDWITDPLDYADDNIHPGILTHQNYFKNLIKTLELQG